MGRPLCSFRVGQVQHSVALQKLFYEPGTPCAIAIQEGGYQQAVLAEFGWLRWPENLNHGVGGSLTNDHDEEGARIGRNGDHNGAMANKHRRVDD